VVQAVPPQDRAVLQQQIVQYGAGQLQQYLNWKLGQLAQPVATAAPQVSNGTMPIATPTPAVSSQPAGNRAGLIQEIAGRYSSIPHIRQNIELDIQQRIAGAPDQVAQRALEDWDADLLGRQPDPDPQTGSESSVEVRILRQLQFAGMRVEQLSPIVQQRLRAAQAQSGSPGNPL
jgi:hypothetical protein